MTEQQACRYSFNLRRENVLKDMFTKKWFWNMWGIKQTLKYIIKDTFRNVNM